MIEQKDLHIGCWYNFANPMYGSESPSKFTMWTEALDFEHYGSPIPLTPDILIAGGFENTRQLALVWHNDTKTYETVVHGGHIQSEIKYLHQLQNLHYCLYGKELDIKL